MILTISILFIIELYILDVISSKKLKKILPFSVFLILIILMGANTQNPDTYIYETLLYNNDEFFSKDFGFGILMTIFKFFGLNYYHLKMFVSIVGIVLINNTLKKYIKDYKLFFVLYLIYPFFFDVVQVRNFFAMSIFIYAIQYLLEDTKKGNIKYILMVLLAATMQKTALIYLPIVFIKKIDKQKYFKTLMGCTIIFSVCISMYKPALQSMIDFLLENVAGILEGSASKLSIQTNFGWIVQWMIQTGNYLLVFEGVKIIKKIGIVNAEENIKIQKYSELILNINYYMFLFLPLYILTPTFSRIMRNVLILNYIVYVYVFSLIKCEIKAEHKKYCRLYIVLVFIFEFVFFIGQYIYSQSGYFSKMIIPILTKNWILEIFSL